MKLNRKSAQNIFKVIFQNFFKLIHGKIEGVIKSIENKEIEKFPIKKNENKLYHIFKVKNGRLYTDRINDTAIIYKKKNYRWTIISIQRFKIKSYKWTSRIKYSF